MANPFCGRPVLSRRFSCRTFEFLHAMMRVETIRRLKRNMELVIDFPLLQVACDVFPGRQFDDVVETEGRRKWMATRRCAAVILWSHAWSNMDLSVHELGHAAANKA